MIKVIQTWKNDRYLYAKVYEETRRFFFFKTKKQYTVWAYSNTSPRRYYDIYTGYGAPMDIIYAVDAHEARKAITNGASTTV